MTFVHYLLRRAAEHPDDPALVFMPDGETVASTTTLGGLMRRAAAVAQYIREQGYGRQPVMLIYPPGPDYIVSLVGALWAGATVVPAYPPTRRSRARFQAIVESCGARVVLCDQPSSVDSIDVFDAKQLAEVEIDTGPEVDVGSDDVAILQYTSGSTGTPKGVRITHRNLVANQTALGEVCVEPPGSVSVSWLPPYHDMGLIGSILASLFRGYTNVFMPPMAFMERPLRWLEAISRFRGALTAAPDFAYRICAETATPDDVAGLDLSTWAIALNGAEPVRATTIERFCEVFAPAGFRRQTFVPCYGLAESTLYVTGVAPAEPPRLITVSDASLEQGRLRVTGDGRRRLVGCGTPAADHAVSVVDAEGRACKDDEVGEIWIAGPSVADGYQGLTVESAHAFDARLDGRGERFFRTGDLGAWHEGQLFVAGRASDRIVVDGRNHYPSDIEATAVDSDPAFVVGGSAAFSIDEDDRERVVLVLETRRTHGDHDALTRAVGGVRAAVSEQHGLALADVVLVRTMTLPRTSSGKVQRYRVKELYKTEKLRRLFRPGSPRPPGSASNAELERKVAALVAAHVGRSPDQIDLRRPVAEYGLSSLQGVRLSSEIGRIVGRPVPVTAWLDHPSVAQMVTYLLGSAKAAEASIGPEREPTSEVAVVGIGLRLPGGLTTLAELAEALEEGRDFVQDRRPATRPDADQIGAGSFLEGPQFFDPDLFGIAPVQAHQIDPQQRLLLDVTRDAVEDAAIPLVALAGRNIGVFVGISNVDYARGRGPSPHASTGNAASIAANRLSYCFDLRGPSMAIDTACSSSLVAVHQACRSIRAGESELAIAAGVNLVLDDTITQALVAGGFLSPRNRCRTFDAEADGYVRGEGCISLVLCTRALAEERGYPIQGIIRGSAVNQDGRSNGLTAPHGPAQRAVVEQAWRQAGVAPADVGYIEAHGTGTSLGDPVEFNTLAALVSEAPNRPDAGPCWIGSIKTNFGHLEAAAGLAGLLKALLTVRSGTIFAHLHLETVNPALRADTRLTVSPRSSRRDQKVQAAAVSAFGFGGTNAHAVLGPPPPSSPRLRDSTSAEMPSVAVLSAHRLEDLTSQAAAHLGYLRAHPEVQVADWCRTMAFGRDALRARAAWPTSGRAELLEQLDRWARGSPGDSSFRGRAPSNDRVLFMFSGQSGSYRGMGRELIAQFSAAASVVDECDTWLQAQGAPQTKSLFAGAVPADALTDPIRAQPALFVLQCALVEAWASLGVEPAGVIGHSLGEYAAAVVAGAWSRQTALAAVLARARLIKELAGRGAMVAIAAPWPDVDSILQQTGTELAADNGPQQFVLSGGRESVESALALARARRLAAVKLDVTEGFHSAAMDPVVDPFASHMAKVTLRAPLRSWVPSGRATRFDTEDLTADYWVHQLRAPVRWAAALEYALEAVAPAALVEIGPGDTLGALVRSARPSVVAVSTLVSSSNRSGRGAVADLAASRAALFVAGVDFRPGPELPSGPRLAGLPRHPRAERPFWSGPDGAVTATRPSSHEVVRSVSRADPPSLRDHVLLGYTIVSAASHVAMLVASVDGGAVLLGPGCRTTELVFRDLTFPQALLLSPDQPTALRTAIEAQSTGTDPEWRVRVASGNEKAPFVHLAGRITRCVQYESPLPDIVALRARFTGEPASGEALYDGLRGRGMALGPSFRWIREAWVDGREVLGALEAPDDLAAEPDHPIAGGLIDSAFQLAAATAGGDQDSLYVISRVGAFELFGASVSAGGRVWVHLVLEGSERLDARRMSLRAWADETPLFTALDVEIRRATRRALLRGLDRAQVDGVLYRIEWEAQSPATPEPTSTLTPEPERTWLLLRGPTAPPLDLDRAIAKHGAKMKVVLPEALDDALKTSAGDGVIVDIRRAPSATTHDVRSLQREGTFVVLGVVQSLLRHGAPLPLWVLTHNVLRDVPGSTPSAAPPIDAPVRGLLRTAFAEGLERVRLIDGEPQVDVSAWIDAIVADGGETEVALRGDRAFVPRLVRVDSLLTDPVAVDPDGAYVIAGGLGALGLHMADWYADRGAQRLVLVGRRPPSASAQARIFALQGRGVEVRVASVDVADFEACQALFQDIEGPIRGLVHAAGVTEDALLSKQTVASFESVFRAKVDGTWNLYRCARQQDSLHHIVFFSSVAATIGSPGQANYAAANAFVDAMANGDGPPTYAVAWGPWAGDGMAARVGTEAMFERVGLSMFRPEAAQLALDAAFGSGAGAVAAMVMDWTKLTRASRSVPPIFGALAVPEAHVDDGAATAFRQRIEGLSADGVVGALRALVLEEVHRATGLEVQDVRIDDPMSGMGLDSLMVVRLQDRLESVAGVKIPVSRFMEGISIDELAKEAQRQLSAGGAQPLLPPPVPPWSARRREPSRTAPPGQADFHAVPAAPASSPVRHAAASTARTDVSHRAPLSLFYFSRADDGEDAYRLLIEGAKFADLHGFKAVWLPERHFHEFGGMYPNPSVLAAALATVTDELRLRSGSIVLPLHHPARVVEEWAVVDRLSRGRVDLSFVGGWGPNDFALAPTAFARRSELLYERLDLVRKLWRGEAVSMSNGVGASVDVKVYPRPHQPELPVWLTCTRNDARFEQAGRVGANVLTALLFQSPEALGPKLEIYRRARREAGHAGPGHVTVMMHAFVHPDASAVREIVREPLLKYLRSSVDLWRGASERLKTVDEDEQERMLAFAFERYFATSGLFGSPKTALRRAERLMSSGVDEIACLVDFGVDDAVMLDSFPALAELADGLRGKRL